MKTRLETIALIVAAALVGSAAALLIARKADERHSCVQECVSGGWVPDGGNSARQCSALCASDLP